MQIIAFGLHKHNIPDKVWQQCEQDIDSFYEFIKPFIEKEPSAEFLFVNSDLAREIFAVVEDVNTLKPRLKEFFRKLLISAKDEELIFHDLQGPDAVKHFFLLALGVEAVSLDPQQEFLERTHESIDFANKQGLAGSVINRMYHDALMLKGKIKRDGMVVDHSVIDEQIRQLISKIFGNIKTLNVLVIGQNNLAPSILDNVLQLQPCDVKFFTTNSHFPANIPSMNCKTFICENELPQAILESHVIFRMNQEAHHLFQSEALTQQMHQRKNQPLLIVNLDSTITNESALNRIYNLYVYAISDFQNVSIDPIHQADLKNIIEEELKDFFTWYYSNELYRFGDIIAKSTAMKQILEMIARISQTDITVLIQGESGTGKEIIARAVHQSSSRRLKPFIVVNCSAMPDTLLESELFGHEKGAFTGATYTKKGLFEEADQGTIFLDEIGDTSPALQVKLLRVLQEGEIKRVGSNEIIHIDVRLIAATNQNLAELVKQKKFRQDLYYRLNVINIDIPPLRERKEDILPLAEYFMGKYSDKMKKQVKSFTDQCRQELLLYPWPGNVRELENAIERAVALAISNAIHANDLPDSVRQHTVIGIVQENLDKQLSLKEIEKNVIRTMLISHNWNYDKVADILDIGRTTLWRKMKEYNIKKE